MITFNVQYLFPLVIRTSSLVYSDAPTSSTASTRSVTFGSIFNVQYLMFNVQSSIFNSNALHCASLPPPLLSLGYRRTATVGSPSGREPRQSRGLSVEELYFLSAVLRRIIMRCQVHILPHVLMHSVNKARAHVVIIKHPKHPQIAVHLCDEHWQCIRDIFPTF